MKQSLYVLTNEYDDNEYIVFMSLLSAVNYYMQFHPNENKEQAYEAVRRVEYKNSRWMI